MIERDRPRLRELRVRLLERDGVKLAQLVDPLGIGPGFHSEPWFISAAEWNVAQLLDGTRTTGEVHSLLDGSTGDEEFVARTITSLSQHFLLQDEVFEEELFAQLDRFRSQSHRHLVGSGREYTSDNIDLRIQLGGIVADDWDMPQIPQLHGLLLPAASFGPAARLYARGYAALRHQVESVDRVVLLGTSDAPLDRLLVPLTMPSKSAFGISALDTEALRALAIVPGRDEIAHRDALVLERHQLFTTLLAPQVPVLPLLVGEIGDVGDPNIRDNVENAVAALLRVMGLPGHTLLISACNFARLIPDDHGLSSRELRTRDASLSDLATRLKAEEYWQAASATLPPNATRAPAAAYLALRALASRAQQIPGLRGAVAGYLQMPSKTHVTTAAAITFFDEVSAPAITE